MRKFNIFGNVVALLLIVSMTAILFAGCQSNENKATQTASAGANADQRKKQMQDNISSLVTDGTINQSQADKIVEVLTTNTQRPSGQNNAQGNAQKNLQENIQSNTQGSTQNRQTNSPLNKLVSDGTITQVQADAVMQKIGGNFQRPQGSQPPKNN